MPQSWIIHFPEDTRTLVHGVLADLVEAVEKSTAEWSRHGREDIRLRVARAARLRIGRRGALFTIADSRCRVAVPGHGAPAREQMLVSGELVGTDGGGDPTELLLRTLAAWRDGLAVPMDAAARQEADHFVRSIGLLGRGLAARLDWPWTSLEMHVGDAGRHSLRLSGTTSGRYDALEFLSWADMFRDGSMSDALIEELDRQRGLRIHASEWHARGYDGMPGVHIGPPPAVCFSNDHDVITTMRGIAAMPDGAELLLGR